MTKRSEEEIAARLLASVELATLDIAARGGVRSKTHAVYMSFVDPDKPAGQKWIGACYIPADSVDEALLLSRILDINPGGEVMMAGPIPIDPLDMEYADRLLTSREEVEKAIDVSKLSPPQREKSL